MKGFFSSTFKDTPEMFGNYFYIEFIFDLFPFKYYTKKVAMMMRFKVKLL